MKATTRRGAIRVASRLYPTAFIDADYPYGPYGQRHVAIHLDGGMGRLCDGRSDNWTDALRAAIDEVEKHDGTNC